MQQEHLEESLAGRPPYRRLFLDAMAYEEHQGLRRTFHAAEKYERNPVVPKDKPWEGWGPYIYGTVMWDEGRLRMWYQCIAQEPKIRSRACYAESTDGINWHKPELGIIEYQGSKANNIVAEGTCGIPSVIRVRQPESEDRAWAVFSFGGEAGPHVVFSSDGLHWRWNESAKHQKLFASSDVINFFYDPYASRCTATYKTANRRHRAVGIALSEDSLNWRKPVEGAVFGADDLDPDPTQVYGMPVFPYQGLYIGIPWVYHARLYKFGPYSPQRMYEAQEGSPCTVDAQMAWSWDLINWTRTPEREPFIALGTQDEFDCGQIYTARAPVIVGDKLYFYYGGFQTLHDHNEGAQGAIGLAALRMDGFCSMRAGNDEGWVLSRRELFRTPTVRINARTVADGYVVAEIVDRWNNALDGFSRADCIPFAGDATCHMLEWNTKAFPADLVLPDKKIRFYVKNADLFSYLPSDINEDVFEEQTG